MRALTEQSRRRGRACSSLLIASSCKRNIFRFCFFWPYLGWLPFCGTKRRGLTRFSQSDFSGSLLPLSVWASTFAGTTSSCCTRCWAADRSRRQLAERPPEKIALGACRCRDCRFAVVAHLRQRFVRGAPGLFFRFTQTSVSRRIRTESVSRGVGHRRLYSLAFLRRGSCCGDGIRTGDLFLRKETLCNRVHLYVCLGRRSAV